MKKTWCIASGYEWDCPYCGEYNKRADWTEEVQCVKCKKICKLEYPEHCIG